MTHSIQAAPARRTPIMPNGALRALPGGGRDFTAIIPPAELRRLVAAMVD